MKHKYLLVLSFILLNASGVGQVLEESWLKDLDNLKTTEISRDIVDSKSNWQKLVDTLSGSNKTNKIEAVAGYLYNMRVVTASRTLTPKGGTLDLNYLGAFDPFVDVTFGPDSLKDFYIKNKKEVNEVLTKFISEVYNKKTYPDEKINLLFLGSADNSRRRNGEFIYKPIKSVALSKKFDNKELMSLIQKTDTQNKELKYPMEVFVNDFSFLDSSVGKSTRSTTKTEYRSLSDECTLCSYNLCKNICTNVGKTFKVINLYRIYGYPTSGGLKSANGDDFVSPEGKKYPSWDFHVASLMVIQEGEQVYFVVYDPLLSRETISLYEWTALFDQSKTVFSVWPFKRSAEIEKKITSK